ncbi:TetR/AcrR family transcriptional regulator [Lacticaseibacillus mingshuiensis]|uniref:TetR/AcrR family transcriptional regulator n=1 Tax=Lacticaseibacillus mingshuiensis TaxID=2799574 RepID=A0ABW4CIY8_9LACO|nr:TetR/AcrR family transcriptional regulator [Lacticaseibacillus mingshuiensis]
MTETTETPRDPEKVVRIEAAALHEFATQGFHQAKTDVIAREAQVSKGLIFHYFGSKANLYVHVAELVFTRLNAAADFSVWRDAPDLKAMIRRALEYKIKMQVDFKDEFALGMNLWGGERMPADLAARVHKLFESEMTFAQTDLMTPVLARMRMRPDVSEQTVRELFSMITNLIEVKARPFLDAHPNAKVGELEWLVDDVLKYLDVLEHGFLAEE